jgi:hypothetical protein
MAAVTSGGDGDGDSSRNASRRWVVGREEGGVGVDGVVGVMGTRWMNDK